MGKSENKKEQSSLPERGDTGGVDPAGDAGGVPFWSPSVGGFNIMILRVTLTGFSVALAFPPSDSVYKTNKTVQKGTKISPLDNQHQNWNYYDSDPSQL